MNYQEFIENINTGKIKQISFSIANYPHYKHCTIKSVVNSTTDGNLLRIIWVELTNDNSEKMGFLKKFKENYKLFDFKRKGKFTLKQLWNQIIINSIEYE